MNEIFDLKFLNFQKRAETETHEKKVYRSLERTVCSKYLKYFMVSFSELFLGHSLWSTNKPAHTNSIFQVSSCLHSTRVSCPFFVSISATCAHNRIAHNSPEMKFISQPLRREKSLKSLCRSFIVTEILWSPCSHFL